MSAVENMSTAWMWVHLVLLAVTTFALRISFIGLFSYFEMPNSIKENLKLVPPAVMGALAIPPFIYRDSAYHLSLTDPFLLSGAVACLVAWKTESLVGTIGVGFVVYFGLTYAVGSF